MVAVTSIVTVLAATLLGLVLWRTGVMKKLWNYPMNWLVPVLFVTFILVKSTGAYLYLVMGIGMWFVCRWLGTALPILLFSLALAGYLYVSASGELYKIPQVRTFIAINNSEFANERSQSLAFRMANEELLAAKAPTATTAVPGAVPGGRP